MIRIQGKRFMDSDFNVWSLWSSGRDLEECLTNAEIHRVGTDDTLLDERYRYGENLPEVDDQIETACAEALAAVGSECQRERCPYCSSLMLNPRTHTCAGNILKLR